MPQQSATIGRYDTDDERPITIHWPTKPSHTAEEDALLCRLYQDEPSQQFDPNIPDRAIAELLIKEELFGGFGGTRVLVVIPVEQNGSHQASRVSNSAIGQQLKRSVATLMLLSNSIYIQG